MTIFAMITDVIFAKMVLDDDDLYLHDDDDDELYILLIEIYNAKYGYTMNFLCCIEYCIYNFLELYDDVDDRRLYFSMKRLFYLRNAVAMKIRNVKCMKMHFIFLTNKSGKIIVVIVHFIIIKT